MAPWSYKFQIATGENTDIDGLDGNGQFPNSPIDSETKEGSYTKHDISIKEPYNDGATPRERTFYYRFRLFK